MAIPITRSRHLVKFSPTVTTNLQFEGDPVTPLDMNTGYIRLPVVSTEATRQETPSPGTYRTIQQQFRETLLPWQCPLFGLLRKAGTPNELYSKL